MSLSAVHDVAVIIVSTREARWLRRCLPTVLEHAGDASVDIVVVDNGGGDGTRALVEEEFPGVRVVDAVNHGFSHANNRALMTVDARYVLFLNPDTEIVDGSMDALLHHLDGSPEVGLAGCLQLDSDGALLPTIRRFPTPSRLLMEALGSERWPRRPSWTGLRELDHTRYERELDIDWTPGSFMIARREALESAGWLDERFFLYCDDPDLGRRIRAAGWTVRYLPQICVVHYADKMGWSPRGYAQNAYAYRQYLAKHHSRAGRRAGVAALALGYGLRAAAFRVLRRTEPDAARAMDAAFRTVIGRAGPPYEPPPAVAVRPRPMRAHDRSAT